MILLCKTSARNKIFTILSQSTLQILFSHWRNDTKFTKLKVAHKGNIVSAQREFIQKFSEMISDSQSPNGVTAPAKTDELVSKQDMRQEFLRTS